MPVDLFVLNLLFCAADQAYHVKDLTRLWARVIRCRLLCLLHHKGAMEHDMAFCVEDRVGALLRFFFFFFFFFCCFVFFCCFCVPVGLVTSWYLLIATFDADAVVLLAEKSRGYIGATEGSL